ncbi:hypothetical protein OC842_005262 [Tilletia horrida]|uniref:UBC core domain-containing protein n=1 Tax=Tilletia horrida TaxID=155126 RepID=A0AAN6G8A5_9BASI|nr:hypothetical protein OC842_005262 [Tilletia horrida]
MHGRVLARLAKEVHALSNAAPLPGIRLAAAPTSAPTSTDASPLDDLQHLHAWIRGPADTPYAGGCFAVDINIEASPNFPQEPPQCTFATQIFHPNISRAGEICVSTLKKDWKPDLGISHILLAIRSLLIAPNPDSALDPESARLLQEDYSEYARIARLWTTVHASPAKCPAHLFADEHVEQSESAALMIDQQQQQQQAGSSSSSSRSRLAKPDSLDLPPSSSFSTNARGPPSPGPLEPVGNVPAPPPAQTRAVHAGSLSGAKPKDAAGLVRMEEDEDEGEEVDETAPRIRSPPSWPAAAGPSLPSTSSAAAVAGAQDDSATYTLLASLSSSTPLSTLPRSGSTPLWSTPASGAGPLGLGFAVGCGESDKALASGSALGSADQARSRPVRGKAIKRGLKRL